MLKLIVSKQLITLRQILSSVILVAFLGVSSCPLPQAFAQSAMISIEKLEQIRGDDLALQQLLLRPDQALLAFPACRLDAQQTGRLKCGQTVTTAEIGPGRVRIYGPQDDFVGIGGLDNAGNLRPRRLMSTVQPN